MVLVQTPARTIDLPQVGLTELRDMTVYLVVKLLSSLTSQNLSDMQ